MEASDDRMSLWKPRLQTVFMQSLAGRGMTEVVALGRRHSPYVINRVLVKEEYKYLLLREVSSHSKKERVYQDD